VQRIINALPGAQDQFRKILVQCATTNPNSLRTIVTLMAFYLHLGPFSRHVIKQIEHRIAELEDEPLEPRVLAEETPHYPASREAII
jgi:hypothetical protein